MKIACDKFNYNLLKDHLEMTYVENFGECDDVFDIVCATWKQIHSYIRHNEAKIKSTLFVVSQYSDASHNRRISGLVDHYNQQYHTNNKLVMIGDGIADWPCHINSPWSRFFFNDTDMLYQENLGTHWTCLMSRGRPHRDLVEKFFVDNLDLFEMPHDFVYDASKNADLLDKFMFRKRLSKLNYYRNDPTWIVDKTKSNRNNRQTDGDLIFPYYRSKIELVVETVTDYFFVTEKTTKPLRAGIPFVVIGSQHFLKKLKKIGFKTFSPWIDETYDDEPNTLKRIQKCCVAFKKFLSNNKIDDTDVWYRCAYNQQIIKSIHQLKPNFLRRQAQKIAHQINHYTKTQSLTPAKYTDGS